MAKKVTLENLGDKIDKGFDSVNRQLVKQDKNITSIHGDLIKHDERTDKLIEMIQDLGQWKRVEEKVEKIREFLRKQHKIEV